MKNRRGKSAFLGGIRDLALNLTIIALCVILVAFIWTFVNDPVSSSNDVAGEGVDIGIPSISAITGAVTVDQKSEALVKAENPTNTEKPPVLQQRVHSLDLRNGTNRRGFAAHYKNIIESETAFTIGIPENANQQNYEKTLIIDYGVDSHSIEELREFLQIDASQIQTEKRPTGSKHFCKLILGKDASFFAVNN